MVELQLAERLLGSAHGDSSSSLPRVGSTPARGAAQTRLVTRGAFFGQSEGKFDIRRSHKRFFVAFLLKPKYWSDLLIQLPTTWLIALIVSVLHRHRDLLRGHLRRCRPLKRVSTR